MTSGRTTEALREHTRAAGRFPVWLYVPAAIGALTLLLPLAALLLRLDGPGVIASVTSPAALQALGLSISTASVATVVCLVLGVPLAFVIARSDPRLAAVLRTLTTLPLVLPPLVGGIALLSLLGRTGLFGEALGLVGIRIPFTTAAVVIAQVFVAMPFLVVSVEGALRTAGTSYEGVAAGSVRAGSPCSAASRCRSSPPDSSRVPSCASRGRSASSVRRRCSRGTPRGRPGPCRSRSTRPSTVRA